MKIVFSIVYHTEFGQNISLIGSAPELGSWDPASAPHMKFIGDGKWELEISLDETSKGLEYKYLLQDDRNQKLIYEWGSDRKIIFGKENYNSMYLMDSWRSNLNPENSLYSAAFTGNIWRRKLSKGKKKNTKHINHRFQLFAPRIDKDHIFCILGSGDSLGNWNTDSSVIMDDSNYPMWQADVFIEDHAMPIHYKFGIYNKTEKVFVEMEDGLNRQLDHQVSLIENSLVVKTDQYYRFTNGLWKGTGVAIPVFSLRTKDSFGVGEFMDLKALVDWSVKAGIKLVQILPINDTVANHTWKDSYPYAAISVFALHPIYLNLPKMGSLKDKGEMKSLVKKGQKLNENDTLDYVSVMDLKSEFFKKLYDQNKGKFLKDKKFKQFFKKNKKWLIPYAAFSALRDRYKTPDFTQWKKYSVYNSKEIEKLVHPYHPDFADFAVHYFIQFHLHLQLSEVVEYARSKGVILKGDLPIGIYRDSVDAWVGPELYHMNKQAGAPPDAYSISGQNWRFPTYNWEEMAKDNYSWWRKRLSQMGEYFDAYRIDHILGFFRIWEIPYDSIEGLMGVFNPAVPMYKHEIEGRGIHFDYDRFCKPPIRSYMLDELFGEFSQEVIDRFLIDYPDGNFGFKEAFNTQRKVENYFKPLNEGDIHKMDVIKFGMYKLLSNVLFLEEPGSNGEAFHPRISFHSTYAYKELDTHVQQVLNEIYTHYFYHRQESFWREQAMFKLPAITSASDMLVCGEDLGMVPDCVPGVLDELGILRLYIQRMPKETDAEFGHPANTPYLSVASPSCHDMSTVRGWWEEDQERSQRFYNQILGHEGEAPAFCDPVISEEVLQQHLYSSAMWAIFPIQDLLAIDHKLKRKTPSEERINDPSNPDNLWRYRFHMNLEDLVKEKGFNKRILNLVKNSERDRSF